MVANLAFISSLLTASIALAQDGIAFDEADFPVPPSGYEILLNASHINYGEYGRYGYDTLVCNYQKPWERVELPNDNFATVMTGWAGLEITMVDSASFALEVYQEVFSPQNMAMWLDSGKQILDETQESVTFVEIFDETVVDEYEPITHEFEKWIVYGNYLITIRTASVGETEGLYVLDYFENSVKVLVQEKGFSGEPLDPITTSSEPAGPLIPTQEPTSPGTDATDGDPMGGETGVWAIDFNGGSIPPEDAAAAGAAAASIAAGAAVIMNLMGMGGSGISTLNQAGAVSSTVEFNEHDSAKINTEAEATSPETQPLSGISDINLPENPADGVVIAGNPGMDLIRDRFLNWRKYQAQQAKTEESGSNRESAWQQLKSYLWDPIAERWQKTTEHLEAEEQARQQALKKNRDLGGGLSPDSPILEALNRHDPEGYAKTYARALEQQALERKAAAAVKNVRKVLNAMTLTNSRTIRPNVGGPTGAQKMREIMGSGARSQRLGELLKKTFKPGSAETVRDLSGLPNAAYDSFVPDPADWSGEDGIGIYQWDSVGQRAREIFKADHGHYPNTADAGECMELQRIRSRLLKK